MDKFRLRPKIESNIHRIHLKASYSLYYETSLYHNNYETQDKEQLVEQFEIQMKQEMVIP